MFIVNFVMMIGFFFLWNRFDLQNKKFEATFFLFAALLNFYFFMMAACRLDPFGNYIGYF